MLLLLFIFFQNIYASDSVAIKVDNHDQGPWKEITMDNITGLPPSKRKGFVYDACLVVVDRHTKMVQYIPITGVSKVINLTN